MKVEVDEKLKALALERLAESRQERDRCEKVKEVR